MVARSRHHLHTTAIQDAGADTVVDEEREVGAMLTRLLCEATGPNTDAGGDRAVNGSRPAPSEEGGVPPTPSPES